MRIENLEEKKCLIRIQNQLSEVVVYFEINQKKKKRKLIVNRNEISKKKMDMLES